MPSRRPGVGDPCANCWSGFATSTSTGSVIGRDGCELRLPHTPLGRSVMVVVAPRMVTATSTSDAYKSLTSRHDIEELASGNIDDLGRPQPLAELAFPAEQHLVEPDHRRRPDPVRIIDQHSTVIVHGVHHGVPVAAEIGRDFRHCPAIMANLERCPPTGPVGDPGTLGSDPFVNLNERDDLAVLVRASPSSLRPDQACSPSEARQVHEFDVEIVMAPHPGGACRKHRPLSSRRDRDSKPSRPIADSVHVDVGQPDEEFALARKISLQQRLPDRLATSTNRFA
jgi:hypothetical protein